MKFLTCVFSWTVAITQRGIEVFFTEEFPEWTDILSRAPVAVTCSKDIKGIPQNSAPFTEITENIMKERIKGAQVFLKSYL